ncbi:MAG: S-layer homology domain-containing protein [Oscillospiraceae bacterium]|nr:S-layer homology domain-containing protein [Oscillospiraceae bacterium]
MKKRFLSVLLTFAMVLSFLPAVDASAAEEGADAANTYTLSVDTGIVNGTVTVEIAEVGSYQKIDDNTYSVAAGAKFTITFEAEEGFVIDSMAVEDAAYDAVEEETSSKVVWSFTMPANNVFVTAAFVTASEEGPVDGSYEVIIEDEAGDTSSDNTYYVVGDQVTVDVHAPKGKVIDTFAVKDASGKAVEFELEYFHGGEGGTYYYYRYLFEMPASDVTVTATYKDIVTHTATVTVTGALKDAEGANIEVWACNDDYRVWAYADKSGKAELKLAAGTYSLEVIQVVEYGDGTYDILRQAIQLLIVEDDMTVAVAFPENNVSGSISTPDDSEDAPKEDAATAFAVEGVTEYANALANQIAAEFQKDDETKDLVVESVAVEVSVAPKTEDKVADKTAIIEIKEKSGDKTLSYVDISVNAYVGIKDEDAATELPISGTGDYVFEIVLSFDMEGKENLELYRHHVYENERDTTVFEVLNARPAAEEREDGKVFFDASNDLIYIYTNKFSTYAIGYNTSTGDGNNNDNGGGGNGGYTGPVNIPGKQPEQPKDETPSVSFSDVPSGAYYADAVAWAVEKGITNGVGGDSFAPEASCTRGQMVTFLWRMAGCPTVSGGASFSDFTTDSYYADAIAWAVSMGITNGTGDGLFSPDAECSRAQMAVFLFRMVGASAAGGSSFGDVDAGAYYADAVAWAVANGITNGTGDGLFSPSMTCTRGQMVTFLFRCFGAQQ